MANSMTPWSMPIFTVAQVDEIATTLTRRSIPFVFVMGYGAEGLRTSFEHAPALTKPVNDRQLVATLLRLQLMLFPLELTHNGGLSRDCLPADTLGRNVPIAAHNVKTAARTSKLTPARPVESSVPTRRARSNRKYKKAKTF
jgi:hypothetical protein